MSEQEIILVLNESAESGIPETLDLWPAIRARVQTHPPAVLESRTTPLSRFPLTVVGLVLLIATALALSPDLRTAAAQGLQRILAGVSARPDGSIHLTPAPPFAVKLPRNPPQGFQRTALLYAPGSGIAMNDQANRLPGLPAGAGPVAQQALKRDWGSGPHLVLVYEAPGGLYFLFSERRANSNESLPAGDERRVLNQNAILRKTGQRLELTWIDEGTWIELESNLPEDDLLRLAASVVTTQAAASTSEQNVLPPPDPSNRLRDLQFCDASEEPPHDLVLRSVVGQNRKGIVTIELYNRSVYPENITYASDGQDSREVLESALNALQDSSILLQRLPYGSISSFLKKDGEECLRPNPQVQGYIVIELWDRQVDIGYGGACTELKERAINALRQQLQEMP